MKTEAGASGADLLFRSVEAWQIPGSNPWYATLVQFEWDPAKAQGNVARHGVSFEDASSVFGDPLATTIRDPDHSLDEERFLTTGMSKGQRLIIVSHTDREARIRIIGARPVTAAERRQYESGE